MIRKSVSRAKAGGPILTIYTMCDMLLHKQVPFGDRGVTAPHLRGKIVQEASISVVNRNFQAKLAKYQHFHIIETTASIATKFCTVIKTTKYSSWVVQT